MYRFKDYLRREITKGNILRLFKLPYYCFFYPSIDSIFTYRLAKFMHYKGFIKFSRFLSLRLAKKYGLYISLKSQIGYGFELRHVQGVVIGDGVILGDNVIIYQQVTLGGKKLGDQLKGNYPIVGNNVTFFSGCKVLGKVEIGDNSVIGANSVVISNVEKNSVYAGVPAKRIKGI